MQSRVKIGHDAHAKGFAYQNKIAHKFSDWSHADFHSTPASGSLHWSPDVYGDVMTTNVEGWHTLIECKRYDSATINHYAYGQGNFRLNEKHELWWSQTIREAHASGSIPTLVYAGLRTPSYLVIPAQYELAMELSKDSYVIFKDLLYYDLEDNIRCSKTMLVDIDKFFEKFTLEDYIAKWQDPLLKSWDDWDTLVKTASAINKDSNKEQKEEVSLEELF